MSGNRQLNIRVNLDTGKLERDAASATNTLKGIGEEAEAQGKRITGVFKNIGAGIAATFAIQRIKSFLGEIINVRSEIQSLNVSFETMFGGNKLKATQLMGQIRQYAANTPMQMNDLAQGAQTLLGFNVEAKKVMPIMQAIGDISMGNRDKFNSLTLAFAQMSATGKLMGQDLLQMINAGFNPLTVISEQTGKAMSTLKDEMSSGAISAKMVEDAFKAATAEGGKFHGMLEQQSKVLRGSISNLQGAFTDMLNDFGESSEGLIAGGVNTAYKMVKNYRETGENLLWLIGIVGAYKAALIVNQALEAAALDTMHAKVAAIAQVNAAQATGFELEVQQAVAKGVLNKAEAEELLMQYQLAKARVTDLTSLKAQAIAEKESAIVVQASAAAKVQAAEQQVIAANAKYEAAIRSANGERIERAELALGVAQSELNAASKAHMAAMTNTAAASKKANAAATAAETAAQELNTLSMNTGTKAAGFLTLAKTQLRNATLKLYAAMTAHPYALIGAAVVALGYGIYKLCTYMTDAEKATKAMERASAQTQTQIAVEGRDIKKLFDALKQAKEGTESYKKAKEDIWSNYGNYLKALGDENTALKDQAKAYALVARKAREAAMAKARAAFMDSEEAKQITDKVGDARIKVRDLIKQKFGKKFVDQHENDIERILNGDANVNPEFLKKFDTIVYSTVGSSIAGGTQTNAAHVNHLREYLGEVRKAYKEIDELEREADVRFGKANDPGSSGEEVTVNFSKELSTAKKARDTAKKQWQKLVKSTTATKTQVEAAFKAYKAAQSTYNDLLEMGTGKKEDTGGKTEAEKAADRVAALQKETDLDIRQLRERRQTILQYDSELEQARIDILDDGIEKRRRQRKMDIVNELAEMQERMQQEIDAEVTRQKAVFDAREEANAAGKKDYAKKTFNPGQTLALNLTPGKTIGQDIDTGNVNASEINAITTRYGVLLNLLKAKHAKFFAEQSEANRLAMSEYLQQYGTYEEQKTAIAAVYAAKRAKAVSDAERMTLNQEEQKALNDIDFDDFISNRASLAFGEIENLTTGTIAGLIEELEKYRSKVTQSFAPDKIEKFNEALAKLKKAHAISNGGVFQQFLIPNYFKERKAAQEEINAAELTHNDLLESKAQKEREVAGQIQKIIDKVKELSNGKTVLTQDQVLDGSTVQGIIGQQIDNGNAQGATDLSNLIDGLGTARTELGNITTASNSAGQSLQHLKEVFASKFSGKGGFLNAATSIVDNLCEVVDGATALMHDLSETAEALGADTSEGSGWDKVTKAMDALSSSCQGVKKTLEAIVNLNPVGILSGITSIFTSWIKGFSAIHDASRERTIQRLQKQVEEIDRINRRLDRRREKEYSQEKRSTYEDEIRNLERQRQLIQQQITAEQDKKNIDNDRIQEWRDQIEEIENTIADYKDAALDAVLGEDIASSIDNFADALCNSWGKAADRAKATKDFVKSMLKQMVIEAMKADLTTPIKKFREMMAKALDDDVVTAAEEKELEAFAQQLGQEMERKYKWADNIVKESTATQQGTSGGFATASQDSIEELSGRASAIHTSGEMRRELLLNIGIDVAALKAQVAASAENTAEMRELQLLAVGHLETIARNTNELYEMNERLGRIERNTQRL